MEVIDYKSFYREQLCDFFIATLKEHPPYISHGEVQMGIANHSGELAPNHRERWLEYLDRQLSYPNTFVLLLADRDSIMGFAIAGTESDGGDPYGIIYDIAVSPLVRGLGEGSRLMERVKQRLIEMGVTECYMESGKENHLAHHFFEKHGFSQISIILHGKL